MPLSIEQIALIVQNRQFEQLVGEIENEYFDAKSQPYHLDASEKGKRELAKDVAAFANSSGGFIFLGFKTKVSMSHPGEEVVEVSPFKRAQVDVDRLRQTTQRMAISRTTWYQGRVVFPWSRSGEGSCRDHRSHRRNDTNPI